MGNEKATIKNLPSSNRGFLLRGRAFLANKMNTPPAARCRQGGRHRAGHAVCAKRQRDIVTVPLTPTAMNRLLAKAMPRRRLVVPEALLVHVIPSGEVRIVPPAPAVANTPLPN